MIAAPPARRPGLTSMLPAGCGTGKAPAPAQRKTLSLRPAVNGSEEQPLRGLLMI